MQTGKKRTREVKAKTKTFSGCWTCRARKVKCDANRPECNRCRKAELKCEGYGLRLYWITDEDTVAPSAIKRQAMSLEGLETWTFQLDEVDQQLLDIEAHEDNHDDLPCFSTGPFGVFPLPRKPSDEPPGAGSQPQQADLDSTRQHDAPLFDQDDTTLEALRDIFSSETLEEHPLVVRGGSPVENFPSRFDMESGLLQEPIVRRLMDNYVNVCAKILPPLPHPENLYSTIYVPQAMAGASSLLPYLDHGPTEVPASNEAIFYAVLATSAFHLRRDKAENGLELDVLARGFRAKAFESLQKALREPLEMETFGAGGGGGGGEAATTTTRDVSSFSDVHLEAILSAMLTLTTMDVMEGSMSEYWIHLGGMGRLARELQREEEHASPRIARLITMSTFLSTLASTTSLELDELPWSSAEQHYYGDTREVMVVRGYDVSGRDSGLEFAYGITPRLANLMHHIVTLGQHISYYVSRSDAFPPTLISACRRLSEDISSWSIESEPVAEDIIDRDPSGTGTDLTPQLAKHHIFAFARALRVYYHTRILPCRPSEMHSHISEVAKHLVEIEELKLRAGYDHNLCATITWPGFVASCEAERGPHRDVWYKWWTGMLQYGIGNITELWQVVQEAWELKDNNDNDNINMHGGGGGGIVNEVPSWVPVLRKRGQHILAV
ncbi:uncharacterized protein PV06_02559 [Exophiala oligosperma]|uniref:Zn(2)-C6 fungal-type domain-containing protein n=1 Tax=Exophiala oligosperma TaxID=215243 RepID=A0A0D2EG81_9EURO|nr:uncharacterized protein PV06_02559 [Exophiala oligosperma]KIW46939.1 hypothetical protein PV06_02559 [Exophiala oligosperma]